MIDLIYSMFYDWLERLISDHHDLSVYPPQAHRSGIRLAIDRNDREAVAIYFLPNTIVVYFWKDNSDTCEYEYCDPELFDRLETDIRSVLEF